VIEKYRFFEQVVSASSTIGETETKFLKISFISFLRLSSPSFLFSQFYDCCQSVFVVNIV